MRSKPNIDRTYGHIDLSTGLKAPHTLCGYSLFTRIEDGKPEEWKFEILIPTTIEEALGPSDWEFVLRKLDTRVDEATYSPIEAVIVTGKLAGVNSLAIQKKVGETVAQNLYRVFCEKQIQIGNKAWLVPPNMVKVSNPNA
jgi:hypothetical protein